MNVADFKAGDAVYIVGGTRTNDNTITEAVVKSVGRKYVHIETSWGDELYSAEAYMDNCLIEKKDWGTKRRLYKSKEAIAIEQETEQIRRWLFGSYSYGAQGHSFTIEQLRAVCGILNPNGEYDSEIRNDR